MLSNDPTPPTAPSPLVPVDGAPPPPAQKHRRGIGAAIAGLGALALKFKALLFALMNLKWAFLLIKFAAVSWTLLLSFGLYVLVFGWQFALVLVVVLVVHELGHYFAFRSYGLPARLPVLVPFLGAFTIGQPPDDLEHDAYIALAGPLTGLLLASAAASIGLQFHDAFWLAIASVSAFLNLFNMVPMPPFDGGRIIAAIWPPLWILGFVLFIGLTFVLHLPIFLIVIIGLLGLPSMISAWKGKVDPRAAALTFGARLRVGGWYLATLGGLLYIISLAPHIAPQSAR